MTASQIRWLVGLATCISMSILGQAELVGEPWRHVLSILAIIGTATSGYMLQNPWDSPTAGGAQRVGTMSFLDGLKKFGQLALVEAPLALQAAGLPPELAQFAALGVKTAQAMVGADNTTKAQEAKDIANLSLKAVNDVLVSKGHAALPIDLEAANSLMGSAVQVVYQATKVAHLNTIGPLPVPTA